MSGHGKFDINAHTFDFFFLISHRSKLNELKKFNIDASCTEVCSFSNSINLQF